MTGAYSDQDPNNLGNDLKQIDTYLKQKFPNLNNWQLIKAETQVVEGINYRFTYSQEQTSVSYEFTVWDRPWLGSSPSRKITSIKKIVQTKNDEGKDVKKIKTFTPTGSDDQWTDKVNGLFE